MKNQNKEKETNPIVQHLQELWTVTEIKAGVIFGFCFTCLDKALGGFDNAIEALAVLMVLDVITGISAAWKHHSLRSAIGTHGLFKKAGIFTCILIGYLLDTAMNIDLFRDMIIAGFALIECMSLIENIDRMGYGYIIPRFIREKLKEIAKEKQLNEREEN